ncbi:hypothetical protein Q3H59_002978 [Pantoea sp. SORGH_AS 659]|nr:hypothetical protein [Pantoea sp. SORGH_AS_0659]
MSLATRVQVFTLKDRQAFDKADYNTLISDAEHALSADLVAKKKCKSARSKRCRSPCRWTNRHNLLPSSHSTARRIFVKMTGGLCTVRRSLTLIRRGVLDLKNTLCTRLIYKSSLNCCVEKHSAFCQLLQDKALRLF